MRWIKLPKDSDCVHRGNGVYKCTDKDGNEFLCGKNSDGTYECLDNRPQTQPNPGTESATP